MGRLKQRSSTMSNKSNPPVATMGIDIGKNGLHVVGLDQRPAIVWRRTCPQACKMPFPAMEIVFYWRV
jgi:hypothetical protein